MCISLSLSLSLSLSVCVCVCVFEYVGRLSGSGVRCAAEAQIWEIFFTKNGAIVYLRTERYVCWKGLISGLGFRPIFSALANHKAIMRAPVHTRIHRGGVTRQGVVLTDLQAFDMLIVNKLLSLSLSLTHTHSEVILSLHVFRSFLCMHPLFGPSTEVFSPVAGTRVLRHPSVRPNHPAAP